MLRTDRYTDDMGNTHWLPIASGYSSEYSSETSKLTKSIFKLSQIFSFSDV